MLERNKLLKWAFVAADLSVIGLLSILLFNIVTIPLSEPADGAYTTETRPEFVWGGLHGEYELMVDDDPSFETPLTASVSGNSFRFGRGLDFGMYYWKVRSGIFSSSVRELTLGSSVILSRTESEVVNRGNVDLALQRVTGSFILGVDESMEIGSEENVRAEQV